MKNKNSENKKQQKTYGEGAARGGKGGRAVRKKKRAAPELSREQRREMEAAAAAHPELRRQLTNYINSPDYRSKSAQDLAGLFGWNDSPERLAVFLWLLRKMELEHEVVLSGKNRYLPAKAAGIVTGVFLANPKGFGFVRTEEEDLPDIHIRRKHTGGALHHDTVLVRMLPVGRASLREEVFRPEGEVLRILAHANEQIIGTFDLHGRAGLVYPDDKRLNFAVTVAPEGGLRVEPGDKVVTRIISWGSRNRPPFGKIIRVLGAADAKGVDMLSVLWQHHLPEDFPPAVLAEAERAASPIGEEDWRGRRDLREQPQITIDGIDAKDLDDAVSCRCLENGNLELSVHIADVAHYVQRDSVLDREAFSRGTSVYLPDRVLPMLPRVLSNGMCSLNAGVDRLALSCTMEIDPLGNVTRHDIYQSVIRVDKRFDYDTVNKMLLDKDPDALAENQEWLPMLRLLARLRDWLEEKRWRLGAVNFDLPETKVLVDPLSGKTLDVVKREQRLAEKIIEQAMIAANETVAAHFHRLRVPFIYRVHEGPKEEKLQGLNEAIYPLGLWVEAGKGGLHPKDVQRMLSRAEGREEKRFVQILTLRSMGHAFYSSEVNGHFGLASRCYSHFTSPIRRYADLSIHRVIKECLAGRPTKETLRKLKEREAADAEQASVTERLAEDAERDAVHLKCCQFMAEKIGETLDGHISGLSRQGIWVELENTIEGRVAARELPADDYQFLPAAMMMKGRRHTYRLGDPIRVRVERVDVSAGEIDFLPVDQDKTPVPEMLSASSKQENTAPRSDKKGKKGGKGKKNDKKKSGKRGGKSRKKDKGKKHGGKGGDF